MKSIAEVFEEKLKSMTREEYLEYRIIVKETERRLNLLPESGLMDFYAMYEKVRQELIAERTA